MTGPVGAEAMPLLVAGGPASLRDAWAGLLGGSAVDVEGLLDRLAGDPAVHCLAFYRSPWETFIAACEDPGALGDLGETDMGLAGREGLVRWVDDASALVAAASQWPGRVRLVNVGRLATRQQALVDALAADGWCAPVEAPAIDSAAPPVDIALLARLFEDYAPEGWDTYESLEAMALLLGREAEFRANAAGPDDPLAEALRIWGEAAVARMDAGGRTRQGDLDARERQALRAELADRDALVKELSSENELLLEHVAQLQQELAEQARSAEQMRETIQRLGHAADQARRLMSK